MAWSHLLSFSIWRNCLSLWVCTVTWFCCFYLKTHAVKMTARIFSIVGDSNVRRTWRRWTSRRGRAWRTPRSSTTSLRPPSLPRCHQFVSSRMFASCRPSRISSSWAAIREQFRLQSILFWPRWGTRSSPSATLGQLSRQASMLFCVVLGASSQYD